MFYINSYLKPFTFFSTYTGLKENLNMQCKELLCAPHHYIRNHMGLTKRIKEKLEIHELYTENVLLIANLGNKLNTRAFRRPLGYSSVPKIY